jgi:hypothetical protein
LSLGGKSTFGCSVGGHFFVNSKHTQNTFAIDNQDAVLSHCDNGNNYIVDKNELGEYALLARPSTR